MSDLDAMYGSQYTEREKAWKAKLMNALWHGGTVQFGAPGQVGSYSKTFDGMKKMPGEIHMHWATGEPETGITSVLRIKFGDFEDELEIAGEYSEYDKTLRRKKSAFVPMAEQWALWKWHTQRGTPVSEQDKYITEPGFKPPKLVWENVD